MARDRRSFLATLSGLAITPAVSALPHVNPRRLSAPDERRDIAVRCWEAYADKNPVPVKDAPQGVFYPTEPAVAFLSAYAVTKETKWRDLAVRQLDYARSLESTPGLLTTPRADVPGSRPVYIHRDMQARQIFNYYLAYKVLDEPEYYRRAVLCAEETVRALPRALRRVSGREFRLFTSEFFDVKTKPRPADPVKFEIDVNQNAGIGLAFALLAADPAPFPTDYPQPLATKQECQAIALRETMASMLLQDMRTGEIPLNESSPTTPDTSYGSYAAFSWVWVTMLDIFGPEYGQDFRYMKPEFAHHIFSAANWLGRKMRLRDGRDIYYPSPRRLRRPVTPSEYTWRLPLYWFTKTRGVDDFVDEIFRYMQGEFDGLARDDRDSFVAAWGYYIVMGFPLRLLGTSNS